MGSGDSEDLSPNEREKAVWGDIARHFSRPVDQSDNMLAQYAATQILAELFQREGYSGIAYESALSSGKNIALFDVQAAELRRCALFAARSVKYKFSRIHNDYIIPKFFPDVAASIGVDVSSEEAAAPHCLAIRLGDISV